MQSLASNGSMISEMEECGGRKPPLLNPKLSCHLLLGLIPPLSLHNHNTPIPAPVSPISTGGRRFLQNVSIYPQD